MGRLKNFEFSEGATPLFDCSGLIPKWVQNLGDLNRVEAENVFSAQKKYFQKPISNPKKWFRVEQLKTMHKAMFGNVWEWAGSYRKSITSIGIQPSLIPMQLGALCHEVYYWLKDPVELTFVEMAARIHHQIVFIHPFENGNGRFSRLVADRFLIALRCPHPSWPSNLDKECTFREKYIQTLKNADKGNYIPLMDFMEKFGARDPKISELLKNQFYRNSIINGRMMALIRALLRRGSNPNEILDGEKPLHLAAKIGSKDLLKLLIEAGAELDAKDSNGVTPFQIAVKQGSNILIDFLISKGARSRNY